MNISEAKLLAGGDFAAHVNLRGGIVADKHGGESGANARGAQGDDFLGEFGVDLVADERSIENARGQKLLLVSRIAITRHHNIGNYDTRPGTMMEIKPLLAGKCPKMQIRPERSTI